MHPAWIIVAGTRPKWGFGFELQNCQSFGDVSSNVVDED